MWPGSIWNSLPAFHPVREAVRKAEADLDPDLVRRLKQFYLLHKGTRKE